MAKKMNVLVTNSSICGKLIHNPLANFVYYKFTIHICSATWSEGRKIDGLKTTETGSITLQKDTSCMDVSSVSYGKSAKPVLVNKFWFKLCKINRSRLDWWH
jgi:hypothetical protein